MFLGYIGNGDYHGDLPSFENADTENEREEKFVLLEQRSTDVTVDAAREVSVEGLASLQQIVALLTDDDRLAQNNISLYFTASSCLQLIELNSCCL